MKYWLLGLALTYVATVSYANDSTGYIGVGGIKYLKNDKISMHSEDLFISKDVIDVKYQFKNLSNQDITETILFPLPALPNYRDGEFADTQGLLEGFQVWVDGKSVKPTMHVQALTDDEKNTDITQALKSCGLTDKELLAGWIFWSLSDADMQRINKKLAQCNNPTIKKMLPDSSMGEGDIQVLWQTQVVYSWKQTFKANGTTRVQHRYSPLVGTGWYFLQGEYPEFCVDEGIKKSLKNMKHESEDAFVYSALNYILTTGANWAKPIKQFKLTVERDDDEFVAFCWAGKGKVTKVGKGKFQVVETDFIPTQDLDIAFIKRQ